MENNNDYGGGFNPSQQQNVSGQSGYQPYDQYNQSHHDTGHDAINRFFGWIRKSGLMRGNNRWIAGVCDGIAVRYDVSPVFVRVVMAAATLACGAGLVFYAAAWALLPDCRDNRILGEDLVHGDWQWVMLGPIICLVLGVSTGIGVFFGLVSIGVLLIMVNALVNRIETGRDTGRYPPQAGEFGPYGPYGPNGSYGPYGPYGPNGSYGPYGPYGPSGYNGSATGPRPSTGSAPQPGPYRSYYTQGTAQTCSQSSPLPSDGGGSSFVGYPDGSVSSSAAGAAGHASSSAAGPASYVYQPPADTAYTYQMPPTYMAAAPQQPAPRPAVSKRLRRRPAGLIVVLLMLGVILVSGAVAALISISYNGLESSLKVLTIWIAVVLAVLGFTALLLGLFGRRAGGLHPMVWIAAFLALVLIGTDVGYSWIVDDMHRANDSWQQVSLSGFQAVDGSDKAELDRLRGGIAVSGNSFDGDVLNIDLSDYAKTHDAHDLILSDGGKVKSTCPTGSIHLTAQRSRVFVTLPEGCSYSLTSATAEELRIERQWRRDQQSGSKEPMGIYLRGGLHGGSIEINPGNGGGGRSGGSGASKRSDKSQSGKSGRSTDSAGDSDDKDGEDQNDTDENNADEGDTDEDDTDEGDADDQYGDTPDCGDDFTGISIGGACFPDSSIGVKSIGDRYMAVRYGSGLGLWGGRGVRIGSAHSYKDSIDYGTSRSDDKDYEWYYDNTKMPKDGPELTVAVPFVVEGKVTVQYANESRVKSYAQYAKEQN